MGKLKCECGNVISDVRCPSVNNGWLLSDANLEEADGVDSCKIMDLSRSVWECGKCGNLAIQVDGNRFSFYRPSEGKPKNLFRF